METVTKIYIKTWPIHHRVTFAGYVCLMGKLLNDACEHNNKDGSMSDFGMLLENEIPRLRRYARALTRDAARADDLVQSCLLRALAKSHLWEPGTDLRAWLFTILHNQHVNDVRRAVREGINVPVEDVAPVLTVPSTQGATLQLRDLDRALGQLPEEQRQVLLLVGLEGMRYEEVAAVLDVPVGTIRSRLSRGREMLRQLMGLGPERPLESATAKVTPLRRPTRAGEIGYGRAEGTGTLRVAAGGAAHRDA